MFPSSFVAIVPIQHAEQMKSPQRFIDLNADMGEYHDAQSAAREAALMALVTSCNVACGGHAGDAATMARTFALAKSAGVQCGAHPSYRDRQNFGRRPLNIAPIDLRAQLNEQMDECEAAARLAGVTLYHVKPHGALYNEAAQNYEVATVVANLAKARGMALFGPPGSALETVALQIDLAFVGEGFVDRAYQMNGALVPRSDAGALIGSTNDRCAQALNLILGRPLRLSGGLLTLSVKTLCIHSDSPGAVETAQAINDVLQEHQITKCAALKPVD